MSVKFIDSLDVPGGPLATLYPAKSIYDVPEFPEVLAKDLLGNLAEQAITASPAICLDEKVRRLDFGEQSRSYRIHTSRGVHRAGSILRDARLREVATPVNFAKHYLVSKANVFPGYSTNMRR